MVDLAKTPPLMVGRRATLAAVAGLSERSCNDCGAQLPEHKGSGRPPSYCDEHRPKPHRAPVYNGGFKEPFAEAKARKAAEAVTAPEPAEKAAATETELAEAMDEFVTAKRDMEAAKAKLLRLLEKA